MNEQGLIKLVLGIPVIALISLIAIVFLNGVWASSVAPAPGDPMYDAMGSLTQNVVTSLVLLGSVGTLGIFAFIASELQSI